MKKRWNFVGGLLFMVFSLAACAPVEPTNKPPEGIVAPAVDMVTPAAEFYKGKTIRFIVGYSRGGGYDTYTRAIARHITRFIPGNSTPIVQNMTGAGSLFAANYIYNRATNRGGL